jgi:hypothetical protein
MALSHGAKSAHGINWHFSDLANESSVGLLCGVKRTYTNYVFDFRVCRVGPGNFTPSLSQIRT